MTSALLANPPVAPAPARPAAFGAVFGSSGATAARGDAIAEAKHEWLQACAEGASSARVLHLYEHYRDLVIARFAEVVGERPARVS